MCAYSFQFSIRCCACECTRSRWKENQQRQKIIHIHISVRQFTLCIALNVTNAYTNKHCICLCMHSGSRPYFVHSQYVFLSLLFLKPFVYFLSTLLFFFCFVRLPVPAMFEWHCQYEVKEIARARNMLLSNLLKDIHNSYNFIYLVLFDLNTSSIQWLMHSQEYFIFLPSFLCVLRVAFLFVHIFFLKHEHWPKTFARRFKPLMLFSYSFRHTCVCSAHMDTQQR